VGIGWLTGAFPPEDWGRTLAYLTLPIITIASQFIMQKMTQVQNQSQGNDPQQGMMKSMTTIMPIFFGYITLQVPAGLTLYWAVSNVFSTVQQYFVTGWGSLLPAKADESTVEVTGRAKLTPSLASSSAADAGNGSDGGTRPEVQRVAADAAAKRKRRNASRRGKKKRRV
jgi:membrane protein insertase Oxa1/YidC/SpoIIIJ